MFHIAAFENPLSGDVISPRPLAGTGKSVQDSGLSHPPARRRAVGPSMPTMTPTKLRPSN